MGLVLTVLWNVKGTVYMLALSTVTVATVVPGPSVFLGLKHCTPLMREQAHGSVINLSSGAGLIGRSGYTCYGASTGGVRTRMKDATIELAEAGVPVNSPHFAYNDP